MVAQFRPERMTRGEAFERACKRNALRREGKLPLIDIKLAVEEELRREATRVHYEAAEHYREAFDDIEARVTKDLCAERGPNFRTSVSSHWMITLRSNREFAAFLECLGFPRPPSVVIPYGSSRAKSASSRECTSAEFDGLPV